MSYIVITVFNIPDVEVASQLQNEATNHFRCSGIEEYSLSESEVDSILGTRSYSGGDIPEEILDEVDEAVKKENFHHKYFFSEQDDAFANEFLNYLNSHFLCETKKQIFADQDWNAEWKKHYQPIEIDSNFIILPEWITPKGYESKKVLRIHPGMGFGTGSHETTFLCLKNYLQLNSKISDNGVLLDYGSGSGILGLATLVDKPQFTADMVDIDEVAHHNCHQNIALNEIDAKRVKTFLLDNRPMATYPLVYANILQSILFEERDYLVERLTKKGYLILSGLLENQIKETLAFYLELPEVSLEKTEIKGDWGCIVLQKNR
jgi:ribosomal protein L11 methyltransferase